MSISSSFQTIKRAGNSISTKFDSIRSQVESYIGTYTGTFGNELRNGTMTGINYANASAINTAIENWLSKIEQDLSQIEAIDTSSAFKGEQFTAAIQDFILSVKKTCYYVSSNLREFQKILNEAIAVVQPPTDKGRRLKLYYMTQASTRPPTFVVFVNDKKLFHFSYERYLINQIRKEFGLTGTPVRMIAREKVEKGEKSNTK